MVTCGVDVIEKSLFLPVQSARESVSKEYEELLKVTKREYDEKLDSAETSLMKERLSMTSKLKEDLREQVIFIWSLSTILRMCV